MGIFAGNGLMKRKLGNRIIADILIITIFLHVRHERRKQKVLLTL